jgi:hypothetical protein
MGWGDRAHRPGTVAGYQHHRYYRSLPCLPCLQAWAAYQGKRKNRGRCAPGLGWPL